jgi:hypothetical protein
MADKKIPLCISYRLKAGPKDITGEGFPLERLESFAEIALKVRDAFDEMAERAHAWYATQPPPQARPRPSRPPHLESDHE